MRQKFIAAGSSETMKYGGLHGTGLFISFIVGIIKTNSKL